MFKNFSLSLVVILILFFTIFGKNGLLELFNFQSKYKNLQDKLISIESNLQQETDILFGLSNSPDYLEQVSREDLGLSKDGEIIYIYHPNSRNKKLNTKDKDN